MRFENIRNLREDNDKLQVEMAAYLNVKQTTYSKYELGKINIPVDVLIKLADFYDVNLDYLVGRTKNKKRYFLSFIKHYFKLEWVES
jgi:transcriptional regulator with XRE-family HTH domain